MMNSIKCKECKEACLALYYMKLHLAALRHGPCLMGSELCANHTLYTHNLQSSTAVTHCLLIATHFTDPQKDD